MTSLKFSITLYDYPATEILPLASAAEAAGFDALWIGEHYVCPKHFASDHPAGAADSENPAKWIVGSDVRLYDPWFILGAIAGATHRLKIGTAICIAPLNHPLILARAALTAQQITSGRFLFGTGVGWLEEEYEALEIPYQSRGGRYDELLDILRQAWMGGYFSHQGRHFCFKEIQITPDPVNVPLILGGNNEIALRRIAKKANGWMNSAFISLEEALRMRDRQGRKAGRRASRSVRRGRSRSRTRTRGSRSPGARR